ncbi:hypothetical protein E4U42_000651 [Claviceps africana]|uniref:N-alpha-acetyltransferase 40 n=1 Tax=Claviceps africana TaxID=83212 RepID=A0A8K0J9U8_9HYPO|nr:hypothetical protein E4U42_000651 [Claviceps africana]
MAGVGHAALAARTTPRQETDPIDEANAKSDAAFLVEYFPSFPPEWTHPTTKVSYALRLVQAGKLSEAQVKACFEIVRETSRDDYRNSSVGWHPRAKQNEMREPEMRYILVLRQERVCGFMSFMPSHDSGQAVLFCYEIHLRAELKGSGLGKQLMRLFLEAGDRMDGVSKVMLQCFVSNTHARMFYERVGFEVDDSSPRERKLRDGRVVLPSYLVLSQRTGGRAGERKRREGEEGGEGGEGGERREAGEAGEENE